MSLLSRHVSLLLNHVLVLLKLSRKSNTNTGVLSVREGWLSQVLCNFDPDILGDFEEVMLTENS